MRHIRTILTLTFFCAAFSADAAKFVIPETFDFLAMDGKEIEQGPLTHVSTLELTEGSHKIALRYSDAVMDLNLGYPDYITSHPFIVALAAEGHHIYRLAPDPEAIKQQRSFSDNPKITILREDGGPVSYEVSLPKNKESRLLRATKSNSNTLGDAVTTTTGTAQTKAPLAESNTTIPATNSAGSMLKYWWSQADKKTRQEFMNWVIGEQ